MKTKTIELPVIPKWLARQIEVTKGIQKEMLDSTDDFVLGYLLRANHAVPEDYEYQLAAGKYIAEHLIEIGIAIKYGYEVEEDE